MNYQNEFARGIKDPKFCDSFRNGLISNFVKAIVKDERFVIHIRNNYFNVYYKSGNVAKVDSSEIPEIDSNYFKYSKVTKDSVIDLYKEERFEEYLNTMVIVMESYWDGEFYKNHPQTAVRPEDEGDVQQKISSSNKNQKTDFDVLDLEYQISPNKNNPLRYDGTSPYSNKKIDPNTGQYITIAKSSPRFDIIAINNGKLYVIELKKGTAALRGKSGMHDHIDSFLHTIAKNEETVKLFINEMKQLLKQKQEFGLIDKSLTINSDCVEFCFAYSFKQPIIKRGREYKSISNIINTKDQNNISPVDYKIIYLEPGDYNLNYK